jgi:hypothetical protein
MYSPAPLGPSAYASMLSASNEANWTGPALNMARPAAVESHLAALGLRRHPEMTGPHKRAHRHYPAARTDEDAPAACHFFWPRGAQVVVTTPEESKLKDY